MTKPAPPPGLDALEAHITRFGAPAAFCASKPSVPELIAYARALEIEVARLRARERRTVFVEEGSFW